MGSESKNLVKNEIFSIFIQIWKFWSGSKNLCVSIANLITCTLVTVMFEFDAFPRTLPYAAIHLIQEMVWLFT